MSGDFEIFLRIRDAYATALPEWMDRYQETGEMHNEPYIMDWLRLFTPIEAAVWSDIRGQGLPFYPQLPVLNYFIDFGCPMLKIGIECDGKAWHNNERDRIRDKKLADIGWTIFRIEGHECKRQYDPPYSEYHDETDIFHLNRWFMETSEGVIHSIKARYFDDELSGFDQEHAGYIDSTLFEHNATPNVVAPHRLPRRRGSRPLRMDEALHGYFDLLYKRM